MKPAASHRILVPPHVLGPGLSWAVQPSRLVMRVRFGVIVGGLGVQAEDVVVPGLPTPQQCFTVFGPGEAGLAQYLAEHRVDCLGVGDGQGADFEEPFHRIMPPAHHPPLMLTVHPATAFHVY